jgi:uncharacterized membrane protein
MNQGFNAVILTHMLAAFAAIALGAAMLRARKGTFAHRVAGRGWVVLMLVTAISSFWIRSNGSFSWIHLLSVAVPVLLAFAVYFAIAGRIVRHQRLMIGIYVGALGVAGAFTLLPHRRLGQIVWSSLGLI